MNNPRMRAIGKGLCTLAMNHLAKREVNATAHVTEWDDTSVTVVIMIGLDANAIEVELSYFCEDDGEASIVALRCRDLAPKDSSEDSVDETLPLPWRNYWANAVAEFLESKLKSVFVTEDMLDFMLEKLKNRHPATPP